MKILRNKKFVFALHGILVLIFVLSIFLLYYYALNNIFNFGLYVILGILFSEGVALALNRGKCPLEYVHKAAGDNKEFFENFLPSSIVKYVIPIVVVITLVGLVLLNF